MSGCRSQEAVSNNFRNEGRIFPILLQPHLRRNHPWIFSPEHFIHPSLPLQTEGIRKGRSVRELRTLERASAEGTRVGARRGFLILQHRFGHGFPRKTARIFEPFFSLSRKSMLNPRHPKSPNPHHFRKKFSQWFLWVLDPVCVAVFGCQYNSMPINQDL